MQTLDVSFNNISDNGAFVIGNCLKDNFTLKELDLSHNMITCEGTKAVYNAFQFSTKLNITRQFASWDKILCYSYYSDKLIIVTIQFTPCTL